MARSFRRGLRRARIRNTLTSIVRTYARYSKTAEGSRVRCRRSRLGCRNAECVLRRGLRVARLAGGRASVPYLLALWLHFRVREAAVRDNMWPASHSSVRRREAFAIRPFHSDGTPVAI